jgi:hypothetical protein
MRKGIKLKQNNINTVGTVPNCNRKTLETEALYWLGTDTSMKSGGGCARFMGLKLTS